MFKSLEALPHLHSFHRVAQEGQISSAARALKLSQPALSRSIQQLEQALGASVFVRSRQGVRLTPLGERLYELATHTFEGLSQLEHFKTLQQSKMTRLRVGVSENLAVHLLAPLFVQFGLQHAEAGIECFAGTSSQIQNQLLEEGLELGVFFTPPDRSLSVDTLSLGWVDFWLVSSKPYRSPDDLLNARPAWVGSRERDYRGGSLADRSRKRLGLHTLPRIMVNNHEAQKKWVEQGLGVALMPHYIVAESVKAGRLFRVPVKTTLQEPLHVVSRKGQSLSPSAQWFLGKLRKLPLKKAQ